MFNFDIFAVEEAGDYDNNLSEKGLHFRAVKLICFTCSLTRFPWSLLLLFADVYHGLRVLIGATYTPSLR